VKSNDKRDRDEQKPGAKQKQTESGATNLSYGHAAFARPNRKCEVQQHGPTPCSVISLTNDHFRLEAVNCREESGEETEQHCEYGSRDCHLTCDYADNFDGYPAYWLAKAASVVFYYTTLAEVNGTRSNF